MKIKRLILLLLTFILLSNTLFAFQYTCGTNVYGEERTQIADIPNFYRHFNKDFSLAYINSFDLKQIEIYEYKTQSDVAVHLARLGRIKESLNILRNIYYRHPEEFIILSNLTFLYELNGKIDSALFINEKSLDRFSKTYKGSNWVHMKILQAKLKMQMDSNWIYNHKVLNLQLKHAKKITKRTGDNTDVDEQFRENNSVISSIIYHIKERIPYTPAPDLLLSSVIAESAELMAQEFSMEHAVYLYYLALEYDPSDTKHIKNEIQYLKRLMNEQKIEYPDDKLIKQYLSAIKNKPPVEYNDNSMFDSPSQQLKKAVKHQNKLEAEEMKKKELQEPKLMGLLIFGLGVVLVVMLVFVLRR